MTTTTAKRPATKKRAAKSAAKPRVTKLTRWKRYAVGSEIKHFADFCAKQLIQSIDAWDGEPLTLERFQLRMMGEALAYGEDGWPIWRSVVMILPRKNGKTQLLAAYAIYRLLTSEGSPEILLAASSDKQAGRLYDAASTFIRRNETLSLLCRVRDYVGEIVREDGLGRIQRMSSDPGKLHGYNPSLVVCDELAQWTTPNLKRAYAALTSGGGARKAPQVFTITTAGEAATRHDSILGRILDESLKSDDVDREPGLQIARLWPAHMLVFNHEAPTADPRDTEAMKLANPASWITPDYLARQAADPELSDAEVLQLHGCVWAEGERNWLGPDVFKPLVNRRRTVAPGERIVLAFDGSDTRDSTALVGCTVEAKPHLWVEALWEKPGRGAAWRVPRREVEAKIAEAIATYDVAELACDPPGWYREIEDWEDEHGEIVVRFETRQSTRMGPACDDFSQAARDRELTIAPSEPLLRHFGHCVPVRRSGHKVVTKEHTDSPRKIDAAVAAIVAYHRARWWFDNDEGDEIFAFTVDSGAHA